MKTEYLDLHRMDCMELMARYPDKHFDLAIVDPPYGSESDATKTFTSNSKNRAAERKQYKQFKNSQPKAEYFQELKRVSKEQIIWGVNFYNTFDLSGGRIVWDKKGTAFGRAEMAYYSKSKSVNIVEIEWNGMLQSDMKNKEIRIHPTQKPVRLYDWLLSKYAEKGQKILDTHMGSGSIAIACHYFGAYLTASELDEDYFNAACERIERETRQQTLFA